MKPRPPKRTETPFQRDGLPHMNARDRIKDHEEAVKRRKEIRDSKLGRQDDSSRARFGIQKDRARFGIQKDALMHEGSVDLPPSLRLSTDGPNRNPPQKPKVENPLVDEFDRNTRAEPSETLPTEFSSPPLLEGLLSSVHDVLGPVVVPTPIQALSLKHLFSSARQSAEWRQYLLAAETGSGKSLAYMLPMLNDLKTSELAGNAPEHDAPNRRRTAYNPRAIVLAPTHELSRQLSATAKSLLHNIKMRVVCASQANNTVPARITTAKLSAQFLDESIQSNIPVKTGHKPVDVLVGTPSKVLEMVRGHGWNWDKAKEDYDEEGRRLRRKFIVGEPEISLHRVEWVIVDEADVLFGELLSNLFGR